MLKMHLECLIVATTGKRAHCEFRRGASASHNVVQRCDSLGNSITKVYHSQLTFHSILVAETGIQQLSRTVVNLREEWLVFLVLINLFNIR